MSEFGFTVLYLLSAVIFFAGGYACGKSDSERMG